MRSSKLQPQITSLTDTQKFLLYITKNVIYLARETLKDGAMSLFPWGLQVSAMRTGKTQDKVSVQIYKKKNTGLKRQVRLQVPTSVCRLSLCIRTVSCHSVSSSNMFTVKLKRWSGRAVGLIILCGQCGVTVKWLMKSNAVFSVKRQCSDYSHSFPEGSWVAGINESQATALHLMTKGCTAVWIYLLSSQTSSGLSPQCLWWPMWCCGHLETWDISSKEKQLMYAESN